MDMAKYIDLFNMPVVANDTYQDQVKMHTI